MTRYLPTLDLAQRIAIWWVMLLVLTMLGACSSLGLEAPKTFNERAAVAVLGVTEVRTQAAAALTAGLIKVDDAQNIQSQADNARAGITIAMQVHAVDPAAADAKLAAARTIVTALQTYLASKGAEK